VNPKNFFVELKRRNVYKVAIAYAVVAWLLMQVASQIFPFFEVPNWAVRLVVLLLIIGFPVALILAWAFELTPEGIKRTETADAEHQPARSRDKAWIYVVIIAALFVIGLLFVGRFGGQNNVAKQVAAPEALAKSIAVLPFENLSHDPDNAYFAEGVKDELLARLSKVGGLKVISIRSTQQLAGLLDDLPQIARKFRVANILEGSVQRSADEVRVNVQLIKAENDAHLWADTFDRKLTDIFKIESEIAEKIATTLQATLSGSEQKAIAAQPTQNTEAHQLYLKGRYLWNRRTGENLKKALAYFEQAAEKDPRYALAYAGIADTCSLIPIYGAGTPQEYLPRARAAARKAIKLDNDLAEAHASLGYVFFLDFERPQSAQEFARAISLNPSYATAHQWYATLPLAMEGKFDQVIGEIKRALELDPVSPIISAELGRMYVLARRYNEAISQLRNTVEMNPEFYWGHRFLGYALELKGSTVEAIAEYHKAFELSDDPVVLAMLAHAEGTTGRQSEARQILAQLTEQARTRYVSGYAFSVIYLGMGEKNEALDRIERATRDHGDYFIKFIAVDPYFDLLHGDPRFEALVSAILSGNVK
jgi:TolB-like protein